LWFAPQAIRVPTVRERRAYELGLAGFGLFAFFGAHGVVKGAEVLSRVLK
jgi:hypothetical protein